MPKEKKHAFANWSLSPRASCRQPDSPDNLIAAREAVSKHAVADAELKRIQEAAIRDVVRLQEDLGLKVVTDGEYNRGSWQRDFCCRFSNVAGRESKISVKFHNQQGVRRTSAPDPPGAGQARPSATIFVDDFSFFKSVCRGPLRK